MRRSAQPKAAPPSSTMHIKLDEMDHACDVYRVLSRWLGVMRSVCRCGANCEGDVIDEAEMREETEKHSAGGDTP